MTAQKIFISGPMFSPADMWEGKKIKDALHAAGFDTYWAPEDGIEDETLIKNLHSPLMELSYYQQVALLVQKIGWTLDIYMATYGCDGMVMDMNGRVPDGQRLRSGHAAGAVQGDIDHHVGTVRQPHDRRAHQGLEAGTNRGGDFTCAHGGDRGQGPQLPLHRASRLCQGPGDLQVHIREP